MAVVSHQGVAGPFEFGGQAYTAFGFRAPALRGFRLTFTGSRDREIGLIGVLPGGVAQDASPGADPNFPPAAIPDGTLQLYLQDSDPSVGETFGWEVSHSVMTIPGARRYQIRDVGCAGACSRVLPANVTGGGLGAVGPPPLIALVGFRLFFAAPRARELDRIGVWFTGNELNLALQDESVGLTDTFGYLVDFIVIPRGPSLDITTEIKTGTATALETVPLPTPSRAHFVLTGWAFNFQPGDREILDIGVLREPNSFTVFYGDTGGGEPFDWRVEYAHLTPRVVGPA